MYRTVFQALLFCYDAGVGALFVLMGIGGITGAIWGDPALAYDCSLNQLGTGLVLLTAAVLLFAVRLPKRWKVGAVAHGVTVVCLGVCSWSMWKVAEVAATRPPGWLPPFSHFVHLWSHRQPSGQRSPTKLVHQAPQPNTYWPRCRPHFISSVSCTCSYGPHHSCFLR